MLLLGLHTEMLLTARLLMRKLMLQAHQQI
jgi:hypothetical protein